MLSLEDKKKRSEAKEAEKTDIAIKHILMSNWHNFKDYNNDQKKLFNYTAQLEAKVKDILEAKVKQVMEAKLEMKAKLEMEIKLEIKAKAESREKAKAEHKSRVIIKVKAQLEAKAKKKKWKTN